MRALKKKQVNIDKIDDEMKKDESNLPVKINKTLKINGKQKLSEVAKYILSKENSIVVNFKRPFLKELKNLRQFARFPPNPEPFWGPKRRAGKSQPEKNNKININKKNVKNDKKNTGNIGNNDDNASIVEVGHRENDDRVEMIKNDNIMTKIPHYESPPSGPSSPSSSPSTKKFKLK